MRFKIIVPFILLTSGIFLVIFSAFITYLIIDEPIGMKMFTKLIIMVLFLIPIIGYLAYYISKKLQKDADELSLMIGSFAHDFKTPLTVIDGYLEEIEDEMISKDNMPDTIALLKNETKFLNDLTVNILDFTRATKVKSEKNTILLKLFLETNVIPLLKFQNHVDFKLEVSDDIEIFFNKMDLKKVFINLLQNSIKFTKVGYIHVYIRDHNIVIEDSGEGIEKVYQEKIFNPYFTVEQSKNREKSGFGLGLAIVKSLCEKNGYKIKIDKEFKNGTRMILYSS